MNNHHSLTHILFPLLCLPFLAAAQTAAEPAWKSKGVKDGVSIFYRKANDAHELKMTTSIQTRLTSMVHIISNVEFFKAYGYRLTEARLLERVSETEFYYYIQIDLPWPLGDRDAVMHSTLSQDPTTGIVTSNSNTVDGRVPVSDDFVRLKDMRVQWKLWPSKAGWMYVEYFLHSDPVGGLPDWLVKMALDVGPRHAIQKLRELVKQPEIQGITLEHIQEK